MILETLEGKFLLEKSVLFTTEAGCVEIVPAAECLGVLRSNPSWEMVINGSSAAVFWKYLPDRTVTYPRKIRIFCGTDGSLQLSDLTCD